MKTFLIATTVSAILLSGINAECNCNPWDSACNNRCVLETNHCISNCQSNDCYTQCISDHWPGAKSGHSKTTAVSSVVWVPTSTAPASSSATWMPSPSAPVSSTPNSATTSVWSQSSSWAPSSTAWYPSYSSGLPSTPTQNSSPQLKATKFTIGMTIAAIVGYCLH